MNLAWKLGVRLSFWDDFFQVNSTTAHADFPFGMCEREREKTLAGHRNCIYNVHSCGFQLEQHGFRLLWHRFRFSLTASNVQLHLFWSRPFLLVVSGPENSPAEQKLHDRVGTVFPSLSPSIFLLNFSRSPSCGNPPVCTCFELKNTSKMVLHMVSIFHCEREWWPRFGYRGWTCCHYRPLSFSVSFTWEVIKRLLILIFF